MKATQAIPVPRRAQDRRVLSAIGARRRLERVRGRVWINGRELGGPDPRYTHLARSYD